MIGIFDFCQDNNGLFCERRYCQYHYHNKPVIHIKQKINKWKMNKIFGAKDSLLYADNNTSWANDLALELGYHF